MDRHNKVLVLGATGGIGGEVARQLRDAGWQVNALWRGAARDREERDGMTWIRGDALCREDVLAAAQGCSVIVHGVNPSGYRQWDRQVLPMLDNSIAAAQQQGATLLLPGTVYNYGPDAFMEPDEDAPQNPLTRKGAIRVELELRLLEASRQGARVLIVRCGDFFGPGAGNNWFSQGLVKPAKPVRSLSYPGAPGIGHQWAYLPDVARTMLALLERRDELEDFCRVHMAGHWDDDGRQMSRAIQNVVLRRSGRHPVVRAFPWWLLTLAAPLVTTFREMQEMRYLWRTPLRLHNARLLQWLAQEPHTPLEQAVETTLDALGCFDSL
ncbi:NAD-dependent epimerase/dehydratase family protein [Pseudomonas chlororaphis]|uniref:NAD-dependent epimerase/dehydratase domain-containing protein n=1 Tax=Pseudomonas chlororaphis TaxID=587753 RepID=A0A1Q8EQW6_9PSED|nr:NAD-dependent epimerase/dehydratase family protein [Pseudomonas chlororaphis]OLF54181.1 hypothetical protein BTN82_14095 [Pseudomonas chlororaphis]